MPALRRLTAIISVYSNISSSLYNFLAQQPMGRKGKMIRKWKSTWVLKWFNLYLLSLSLLSLNKIWMFLFCLLYLHITFIFFWLCVSYAKQQWFVTKNPLILLHSTETVHSENTGFWRHQKQQWLDWSNATHPTKDLFTALLCFV